MKCGNFTRLADMKVNAAIEDAAELAEGTRRLLAQAKTSSSKIPTQDWKRAQALLVHVAVGSDIPSC